MHDQKTEKMVDEEVLILVMVFWECEAFPAVFVVVVAGVVVRRGYFQLRLLPSSIPFLY